jgi:hypothetical protein
MSTPSIKVGQGNWGIKALNLLGYANTDKKFVARDFTVGRLLDTATRVNASGNIEGVLANVPRIDYFGGQASLLVEPSGVNYLLRSQEFDNASWVKNASGINTLIGTNGIEANAAISPDGTQNADRVNFLLQTDPDLGLNQNYAAATSTQTYNTSIWFKGEGTNIGKQIKVQMKRATGGTFVGTTATITLTSGWVRFASSTITLGALNSGVQVIVSSNDATNALIWGAQLEQGSVPTSYIPTTTGSVTRNADVISLTGVAGLIGQTEGTIYAEVDLTTKLGGLNGDFVIEVLFDANTKLLIRRQDGSQLFEQTFRVGGTNVFSRQLLTLAPGIHKFALAYKSGDNNVYVDGSSVLTGVASGGLTNTFTITNAMNRVNLGHSSLVANTQFNDRIRAVSIYQTRLPNTTTDGSPSLQSITTL